MRMDFNQITFYVFIYSLLTLLFVEESQAACSSFTTCGDCISSSYTCSWCSQKNFTNPRCNTEETLLKTDCLSAYIDNPQSSKIIVEDDKVRDGNGQNQKPIQIQPQKITLKARPREEHRINMAFRAANNFPVDLYFLFDNSVSMNATIKSLAKLADDIGQAIGDISSNYKMGYGVFQDKVILPFTDTSPERMKNPCATSNQLAVMDCAPPFEFRHVLSMTTNIGQFKNKIHSTKLSGNVDHPEGSLDALMQAVTCKSRLGWREDSRKLLIFASNGPFKTAGAGKLAGIVVPNDGYCHLNSKDEYDKQIEQDYPSVSQLTDAVETHEIHVIFAVTNELKDLFDKLSFRVPNSVVELLADNPVTSNNQDIKDIIEHKYKEMISEVEIVHNNVTGIDVQIRAISDECKSQSKGTNKCKGIKIGNVIEFEVDVKVTECPAKPEDRKKQIIFHPNSLKKDTMALDIEIICDCGCKHDPIYWERDSDACSNGNGTLKCGICECYSGRFGQYCQCSSTNLDSGNYNCRKPGTNSTECSGAGVCKCGVCDCDEGFSGPYCECNDHACGSFEREVCGGSRGQCVCGKCVCEDGYTGSVCGCPTSNRTCLQDGEVCSGAGTCNCGKCECDKKYTGKFCQNCFLCGEDSCNVEMYRTCSQCAIAGADEIDCSTLDCPEVHLVNSVDGMDGSSCSIKQSDGCFLQFLSVPSESNVTLYVQRTKSCPQPVNIYPIIGGVIGGVVAIGILLLILWKILTSIWDKVEYSKFQEEVKNCNWAQQDNPFYKGATTTYKNPLMDKTASAEALN